MAGEMYWAAETYIKRFFCVIAQYDQGTVPVITASSTFKGGDIRLTGQVLNTPVPVVSKPADYVYTLKTEEPVDLNLEMDVAILNAIDGTVYENEVRLRLTSDYKG